MSSVGECSAELFMFPIVFQTVSFHHRGSYELHFSFSLPVRRLHPIKLYSAGEQRELIDRNGNAWNMDGHTPKPDLFSTFKFPIEYNDQIVKFKTGFLAGLQVGQAQRVGVTVELVKLADEGGKGKRVSCELLEIRLGGDGEHMRRLVFSTNEYISFVDVAFHTTRLAPALLRKPSLLGLYRNRVLGRLQLYQSLAAKVSQRIEEFRELRRSHPTFIIINNISQAFLLEFAEKEVNELAYLKVILPEDKPQENADSHSSLQKSERTEAGRWVGVTALLCDHYHCNAEHLKSFIEAEGRILELNIRALFERLTQLTIAMLGWNHHLLTPQEVARVRALISHSQQHVALRGDPWKQLPQKAVAAHRLNMTEFMQGFHSVTGAELKQPYVEVRGVLGTAKEGILSTENTLTVFIHGYKGNQYDLSKMKSHLILLFGCTHFYSIKGLSADKANQATIAELGQTAAKELLTHLALAPSYQRINFIGFSLGGVIARAMLPWLKAQRSRLGLLLTIATPHLGVREVKDCLVRAGLCYMRRVAGIESIRELNSQRDSRSSRYLLQLAEAEGLEWFDDIVLVGSFEDSYVPAYSSLAQYAGEDELTLTMADRLARSLSRAIRVTVKLDYNESLVDIVTRRRSHISFLEDDSFIRHLFVRLHSLFAHSHRQ